MKVANLISERNGVLFQDNFRVWYESFQPYWSDKIMIHSVKAWIANKFTGDFYGLLNEIGIERKYHYFYMRLNDLMDSGDYDGVNTEIKLMEPTDIDIIASIYNTASGYL